MDSLYPPRSWDGVDDVIIAGGGLAGLVCALRLAPRPVTIVTAGRLGDGPERDSSNASSREMLSPEAHAQLGQISADGVSRDDPPEVASILAILTAKVRSSASIQVLEGFVAEQLRAEGSFVTGIIARDRRGGLSDRLLMPARGVVLATGGIAGLYEDLPGASGALGEGLGIAARAGALIADPELVQFRPGEASGTLAVECHVGGVHVDGGGRTTLDGLWACGEVACTGASGATCSGATALSEAVIIASRAAEDILGQMPRQGRTRWMPPHDAPPPLAPDGEGETLSRLGAIMRRHVGRLRERAGLVSALAMIERLLADARTPRVRNALAAAQLIAAGAVLREESRGAHRRSDFPASSPRLAARTFLTRALAENAARAVTLTRQTAAG